MYYELLSIDSIESNIFTSNIIQNINIYIYIYFFKYIKSVDYKNA